MNVQIMNPAENIGTHQKALKVNLDPTKYGTFAEIGAGQEVARWFFRVGGAAGTIAKSMSAYDMTISDAIYGQSDRYVSRQRLHKMLDHEFGLMLERLQAKRGADTRFFVFADTVAAKSFKGTGECHGWMGIRFQNQPGAEPSQIIIHVRMLDRENLQQQEALGIIGVNLVYGAFYLSNDPKAFIGSLLDDLTHERVEVDPLNQYLLPFLDGSRDCEDLVDLLLAGPVAGGKLVVEQDDQPVTDPAAARQILAAELQANLEWLARAALLVS